MAAINPYRGLKPFDYNSENYFFGRESHALEAFALMSRSLHSEGQAKLLAIIGDSGSGKSSFVRAGLIPTFLNAWREQNIDINAEVIYIDPISSFSSLKESLKNQISERNGLNISRDSIDAMSEDPSEWVRLIQKLENLLNLQWIFCIDQFEELIKTEGRSEDEIQSNSGFIQFITQFCAMQSINSIFIITMRSDFLGLSSLHLGLTAVINDGIYLMPIMSREDFGKAITGPAALVDTTVDADLIDTLWQDCESIHNYLPVLQHLLHRMFTVAHDNGNSSQLDLELYHKVGTIENALTIHAEEIFMRLSTREKIIARDLFCSLIIVSKDLNVTRRPETIQALCKKTGAGTKELIKIIDLFRHESVGMITPTFSVIEELDHNTRIDISHESVFIYWERFKEWSQREINAVSRYKSLVERAYGYENGISGVLVDPERQIVENWYNEFKPTKHWGNQYHSSYEKVIGFIEHSNRSNQDRILFNSRRRRRARRTLRIGLTIMTALAICAGVFGIQSRQNALTAENNAIAAGVARDEAAANARDAEEQKQIALISATEAEEQAKIAQDNEREATSQRKKAEANKQRAITAQQSAEAATEKEMESRKQAEREKENAIIQRERAEIAESEERKLRLVAESRLLAEEALMKIKNTKYSEALITAMYAYSLNLENNYNRPNQNVYDALRGVVEYYYPNNNIQSDWGITASTEGLGGFFSADEDGEVLFWPSSESTSPISVGQARVGAVTFLTWLSDKNMLVVTGTKGKIALAKFEDTPKYTEPKKRFIQFETNELSSDKITGIEAAYIKDKSLVFLTTQKNLYACDFEMTSLIKLPHVFDSDISSLSVIDYKDGYKLIIGEESGNLQLITYDLGGGLIEKIELKSDDGRSITATGFLSHDVILIGTDLGNVYIDSLSVGSRETLTVHKGAITRFCSDIDSKMIVSVGMDKSAIVWDMDSKSTSIDHFSIRENSWINSGELYRNTRNELSFISFNQDGSINTWPTKLDMFDSLLCDIMDTLSTEQLETARKELSRDFDTAKKLICHE